MIIFMHSAQSRNLKLGILSNNSCSVHNGNNRKKNNINTCLRLNVNAVISFF